MRVDTYAEAFDVASVVRMDREIFGIKFFPGVERAAALACVDAKPLGQDAQIDAMAEAFSRYEDRCPRWDGSIA